MIGMAIVVGWAVVAFFVMRRLGVFRAASVVGPDRISGVNLLMVSGLGMIAFFFWGYAVSVIPAAAEQIAPGSMPAKVGLTAVGTGVCTVVLWVLLRAFAQPRRVGLPADNTAAAGAGIWRGMGLGALGVVLTLPWIYLTLQGTLWIRQFGGQEDTPKHDLLKQLAESGSITMIVVVYLSAAVVTPIFEELLFRGVLQTVCVGALPPQVSEARRRWGGIVMASGLFALMHAGWSSPAIFVLSLGLGYLYERTGRLWPVVVMHAIFNATSITLSLVTGGGGA